VSVVCGALSPRELRGGARADARAWAARVLVFAATLAGIGLGVSAWRGLGATAALTAHVGLGFAVAALAALQVAAVAARPKPSAPRRRARPPPRPRHALGAQRLSLHAPVQHGARQAVPGVRCRCAARPRSARSGLSPQGRRCRALLWELTRRARPCWQATDFWVR
jgi:hypothetical protein